MTKDRRTKENRWQKTHDRRQKADGRRKKIWARRKRAEDLRWSHTKEQTFSCGTCKQQD